MKFMKFMKSVQLTRRRRGRCCSAAFNITADAHGHCKRAERRHGTEWKKSISSLRASRLSWRSDTKCSAIDMRIFKRKKNPAPALKSRRSNAPAPHAVTNRERFLKALKILSFAPRPAPRFFRTGGQSFMRFASCVNFGKSLAHISMSRFAWMAKSICSTYLIIKVISTEIKIDTGEFYTIKKGQPGITCCPVKNMI